MARIMPIEDFGMLKRVFAFLYIGAIFMESVQTVVVKYSSNYKDNNGRLKSIFLRTNKKIIPLAAIVGLTFLTLSLFLSPLFNIAYSLLFSTSIFIAFSIFVPVARGILQGQQRFLALGLSMLAEAILKIGISFFLVYIGLGVLGAVWGVVISLILSLGISLIFINKVLSSKVEDTPLEGIRSYSRPVFLITSALILFINLDILIAGNLFNQFDAGIYAIASTISLIIFIAVQPINKVLFPITALESANNRPSKNSIIKAMTLVSIICFVSLALIFLFTDQIIYLISGRMLPDAKIPVMLLSVGTTLLSISSTLFYYKLSLGRTRGYLWSALFLIVEIALLILMSSTLINYALGFLIANLIFFIGSLILLRK